MPRPAPSFLLGRSQPRPGAAGLARWSLNARAALPSLEPSLGQTPVGFLWETLPPGARVAHSFIQRDPVKAPAKGLALGIAPLK